MLNRARSGSHIQAALAAALLSAVVTAASPSQVEVSPGTEASDTTLSAADTSTLLLDIKPVLAHSYPGIDTAALLARVQERQKWGEKDDRLIEAEGILHW